MSPTSQLAWAWIRRRFDPEDIARFRDRQRRVEQPPNVVRGRRQAVKVGGHGTIDFNALLEERRAVLRLPGPAIEDGAP